MGNDDLLFGLPVSLEEAVETFIDFYEYEQSFVDLACAPELVFLNRLHPGAGQFIRNNWYLSWKEGHNCQAWPATIPPLVKYFNDIGIMHADDMSTILISAVWHKMNNKPFDIIYTVKVIQNYRRNS